MKFFLGFIVFIDLLFLWGCLFFPRTGMEAMGSVFMLIPLAGLHVLGGLAACFIQLRKKRWAFPIYFAVITCLMSGMWYLYGTLKPTYRPLHRVLIASAKERGHQLSDFKDRRILAARRLLEGRQDRDHADLCEALDYPVEVDRLAVVLEKKPDLSLTCAMIQSKQVLPVMAVMAEGWEPWSREDKADQESRLADIRTAVDLLLKNGADPNSQDGEGNTPLHWSLRYRDEKMVSLLIGHGACVYLKNNEGFSVMNSARSRIGKIVRAASEDPQMVYNCPQVFQQGPNGKKDDSAKMEQGPWAEGHVSNIDRVVSRLSNGADPNGMDSRGRTVLQLASTCRKESPAIVEILLVSGADVNGRGQKGATPLMTAVRNHCPEVVAILLEKGADATMAGPDGATAMRWMARWEAEKMIPTIDLLLAAGAKIDARDRLGRTPLMMTIHASLTGDDAVAVFLAKGANPDATDPGGNTLMHLLASDSAKKERATGVSRLIEAGASIDLRNRDNMTPLMLAVNHHKVEIAQLLLEAGASPDVAERWGTPLLHSAVSCKPEKLVLLDLLIGAGCDVNIPNKSGQTALHRALMNHLHVTCIAPVERLLQAGANPNIHDQNGIAPLHNMDHWEQKDSAEALALMKKFGADIDIRDQQGMTTLLRTARFGTSSVVMQALINAGADPSAVDERGNNQLHCMAMNTKAGDLERLQIALASIKNLNTRNQSGQTALELARKHGNENMIAGLIEAGANQKSR